MLFSSIPFLYYFLPCVLFVYFIVPKAFKNAVLQAVENHTIATSRYQSYLSILDDSLKEKYR